MQTISVSIANYCVPCECRCRYCLLASCGKTTGVDQQEAMEFADRVFGEIREARPEIANGSYYVGYSMDMPDLAGYIRYGRERNYPCGKFLQMNGFAFRTDKELDKLLSTIRDEHIELIDLTFYGTEEYHDRFAGRKGDFTFDLRMLAAANRAGVPVTISVPLMKENLSQLTELLHTLQQYETRRIRFFPPHSKGRGRSILDQRITKPEFDNLPEEIRGRFILTKHMTEAEWLASGAMTEPEKRSLTLVLTPENFDRLQAMSGVEILAALEGLDDRYREQMPSVQELAKRYGNPEGQELYRIRDLALKWEQQYIADTGNTIWDMHDETHHFAVHE